MKDFHSDVLPTQAPTDPSRRDFLIKAGWGLSGMFLPTFFPAGLGQGQPLTPPPPFRLQPQYRSQTSLDLILAKVQAGSDEFRGEKVHSQIAAILDGWSASLRDSPQSLEPMEKSLARKFSGTGYVPAESRLLRSDPFLEVRRNSYSGQVGRETFLEQWRSSLATFAQVMTAEFLVTGIELGPVPEGSSELPNTVRTSVRYDLVGKGSKNYREQRVGECEIEWEVSPSGGFQVRYWKGRWETHSRAPKPIFVDVTAPSFARNPCYESQLLRGSDYWRTVLDGASHIDIYGHNGVAVGDIDGDGLDELYVCQPSGLPNRLFRNRGDGTFEDITENSGLGILENTACALFLDVNNDGHQDLVVVRTSGPILFLNQGGGKFVQRKDAFRFATPPRGTFTGAAAADYDRDGWLDIYFCLYIYYQGTDKYRYPLPYYDAENGPPNFLMRNQRDGTFRDVTAASGLDKNNNRYSFCCAWSDYNRDGWPDLYVVNDFGRKNLYRNHGDGTFTDVATQAGVEDVGAGMGVCFLDYDNDGAEDLYVADMWTAAGGRVSMQENFQDAVPANIRRLYQKHARGNSMFRNLGHGTFEDTSANCAVEMGRWSWASDAWDFDHDGFPDLYVTNGMVSGPVRTDLDSFFWRQVVARSPSEAKPSREYEQGWNGLNELLRSDFSWSGYERNVFYVNNGDGTFSDVSGAVGLDFLEDGRAFALSDFDHDGRLEIVLKSRNSPQIRLLKNAASELGSAIAFRLEGTRSNRDAIGASVTLDAGGRKQTRWLRAGSGFLSQHSKELFFGLGRFSGSVGASIQWPSGLVQEVRDLPPNHRIWVREGEAGLRIVPFREFRPVDPSQIAAQPAEQLPAVVETWLLAPVAAPEFALPDSQGKIVRLSALRGKLVLLHFWSRSSPECERDLATLDRFDARAIGLGLQILSVRVDHGEDRTPAWHGEASASFPILRGSEDVTGPYNILYRYIFDRHRDLPLPCSFLIDRGGEVVKIYQGPVELDSLEKDCQRISQAPFDRVAAALPFAGVSDGLEFQRNYLSQGSVFYQRGYFEPAESAFRAELRQNPLSAEAMYGLGSVYLEQKNNTAAREALERVLKMQPSYPSTLPNAWNNLGLLAAREGRMTEAVSYFQEALKLSPDHVVALVNLGNAFRQEKRWPDARAVLERALAVSPSDPDANYSLGMVFAQLEDTGRAHDYLQRALKFRPVYPEALNNLGILYLRTGRRDQAVESFEKSIRLAPSFHQSYLNLARLYALEGHKEKARAVLVELLRRQPDNAEARSALAELSAP